ncbi:MAG: hypothetical protein IKK43_04670 [Clostridia bacterium]|nr:hypothetical protein [Clostridia bacterium]
MANFDKKHHDIQNMVNNVIYHAPHREFTIEELIEQLKSKLPEGTSAADKFYATELLRGTICRLVLSESIRKIDDVHYLIKEN